MTSANACAQRVPVQSLRRAMLVQTSPQTVVQNGLALLNGGDEGLNIWNRIGSLLPLIALVAGLATIQKLRR